MILGPVIHAKLTSGAVGAIVGDRIYPLVLPQNPTLPAITYQQISNPRDGEGSLELRQPRVQFNCFGLSALDARTLADALIQQLRGWSSKGDALIHANDIGYVEDYDDETETYRVMVDVTFFVCE